MKHCFFLLIAFLVSFVSMGQSNINIPQFDDKYSHYVAKLEKGETDIDYQDFRYSLLESKQFLIIKQQQVELKNLENEMYNAIEKENFSALITICQKMLNIDYTSLIAHKILRQTYEILKDNDNAVKYKTIQFGLLKSITENGNGKTCATAWPVIQIAEEYFILRMLGAELIEQSIYNVDGLCDKMLVSIDNEKTIYYFEITKVFEGHQKR